MHSVAGVHLIFHRSSLGSILPLKNVPVKVPAPEDSATNYTRADKRKTDRRPILRNDTTQVDYRERRGPPCDQNGKSSGSSAGMVGAAAGRGWDWDCGEEGCWYPPCAACP